MKTQAKNPVMFLVFVSAILTSILWLVSLFGLKDAPSGYTLAIAIILWFTVLFANFAEAIAEGRGKAQADSLRASRKDVDAHKIPASACLHNMADCSLWERESGLFRIPGRRCGWKGESIR